MANDTLEHSVREIESAVREVGSFLLDTVPQTERQEDYRVALPRESFLELLKHCKPRIVYTYKNEFDARQSIVTQLLPVTEEGGEAQAELLADPRVAPLVERFSRHNGQVDSFVATFVVDGVLHSIYERTAWVEALEEQLDELEAVLEAEREDDDEEEDEVDRERVRDYATRLCENPKFTEGRPSREKRIYLTRSLFPELTDLEVSEVVEEATNMTWLHGK
jgi:hypothetical protein